MGHASTSVSSSPASRTATLTASAIATSSRRISSSTTRATLKISDFGLSARQQPEPGKGQSGGGGEGGAAGPEMTPLHLLHTTCGTPNYVAPEVLLDQGYDGMAADVWSAGVILYVLLAGYLPFDEVSMVDLFRKIVKVEFTYPPHFSPEAIDLLNRILTRQVENRATMAEIQRHPWMTKGLPAEEGVASTRSIPPLLAASQMGSSLSKVAVAVSDPSTGLSQNPSAQPSKNASPASSPRARSSSSAAVDDGHAPITLDESPMPSSSPNPPSASGFMSPHALHRTDSRLLLQMDEDEEEEEVAQRRTLSSPGDVQFGPRHMNAFDLINMVGGQAMNRMFVRGLHGLSRQVKTTQFTSSAPCDVLLERLETVLSSMEGVAWEVVRKYAQVRAVKEGDRGQVALCAQVYEMTPALHMVECRKLKGDMFFYYDLFTAVKRQMEAFDRSPDAASPTGEAVERQKRRKKVKEEEKADGGQEEDEEEETVIQAGSQSLTLSRPGSASSASRDGGRRRRRQRQRRHLAERWQRQRQRPEEQAQHSHHALHSQPTRGKEGRSRAGRGEAECGGGANARVAAVQHHTQPHAK